VQQRTGSTGVVEMNVGQKQRPDVVEPVPEIGQTTFKRGQTGRRTWIDQGEARGTGEDRRPDDVLHAEKP
jgi:hypothetical protein